MILVVPVSLCPRWRLQPQNLSRLSSPACGLRAANPNDITVGVQAQEVCMLSVRFL